MLRAASSSLARRAILNSSSRQALCAAPRTMAFHATTRQEEEAKPTAITKGGLFGTGISEWFALPIGLAAAIPIIKFDIYVINEETQLAAVFIAFCVTVYTQAGDAIYKSLDENAQTILKEQNDVEDKVIASLEQKLEFLKANSELVDHFEGIHAVREETYKNLNAAGAVKPYHDFKGQVERALNMIAQEEASVADKNKMALMQEAITTVTEKFSKEKPLKKAALDSAIANIKGNFKGKGKDPVQAAFVNFFKEKGTEAKEKDDGSEERAERAALVAKLNTLAKNEGYMFTFDNDGNVKMTV